MLISLVLLRVPRRESMVVADVDPFSNVDLVSSFIFSGFPWGMEAVIVSEFQVNPRYSTVRLVSERTSRS